MIRMSILITKQTKVIIQGITGKEGQKAAKAMLEYGTNVVGGVTPKKGGQEVEGKPVFDTVREAINFVISTGATEGSEAEKSLTSDREDTPRDSSTTLANARFARNDINKLVSAIYVPPFAAKAAILEAIDNDIPQISVIVERIPIKDTAYCLAAAREKGIQIIGPSSLGYIAPGVGRIGVVGGPLEQANEIYRPGPIGSGMLDDFMQRRHNRTPIKYNHPKLEQ